MSGVDLLLLAVTLVAGFVQATIGVGFALIVAPVAVLVRPDLLPGALLLLMMPLNAWVAWDERAALDGRGVSWITAGRVLGAVIGIWVLAILSLRGLSLLIGASTILAVGLSLLAPRFRPDRMTFVIAGLVTGVTETATGIGGPPLALVFQHHVPATLRANLALCFLLGEIVSAGLLVATGALRQSHLLAALLLLPALVIGVLLSGWSRRLVDARGLRTAVLAFALLSAVVIMVGS